MKVINEKQNTINEKRPNKRHKQPHICFKFYNKRIKIKLKIWRKKYKTIYIKDESTMFNKLTRKQTQTDDRPTDTTPTHYASF